MNPGKYRHRIVIEEEDFDENPDSGETESAWKFFADMPAAVKPLRGREYFQAKETHFEQVTMIEIRYYPGITAEMRVLHEGNVFYITDIIDPEERHREMYLMCTKNKPKGPGEQ